MARITEDYVSFETSKLLKEKGFDCETDMYYSPEGELKCWIPNGLKSYLDNKGNETWWWKCIAPTLQMAMKWLREVHNLFISPRIIDGLYIYVINDASCYDGVKELEITAHLNFVAYQSPEEACEASIKYCLENLI